MNLILIQFHVARACVEVGTEWLSSSPRQSNHPPAHQIQPPESEIHGSLELNASSACPISTLSRNPDST